MGKQDDKVNALNLKLKNLEAKLSDFDVDNKKVCHDTIYKRNKPK